jgi:hypothetical protein
MVLTPCLDGRLDVRYTNSLIETVRMGEQRGIAVFPRWRAHDALVQRVRNDLLADVMSTDVEAAFWIDSDVSWMPDDFFRMVGHGVDAVAALYPKKTDIEDYPVFGLRRADHLMRADAVGFGFFFMSRAALNALWMSGAEYADGGISKRWAFDVSVSSGAIISEDVTACRALARSGIALHIDPDVSCNHTGIKSFAGNQRVWSELQCVN